MKAEYINPFVLASFSVLEMVLGARPVQGKIAAHPNTFVGQPCSIICGVSGQVQGQVIYGMSLATADNIASSMLGQTISSFDDLALSAIGELGNMISGNAMQFLSDAGWTCDITPPTVLRGEDVSSAPLSIPAVVVPMTLGQGELFITIGIQGRK
jgi:chemotaxis protein CheX